MHWMHNKTPEERSEMAKKAQATAKARREREQLARQDALTYAGGLREEIADLEARLAALQHFETINAVSCAMTGKALMRPDEISAASLSWEKTCGVYFLLDGSDVVYVGQSKNVFSRIAEHRDKRFDRYAYVPCEEVSLDTLESFYIYMLRPKLNGMYNSGAIRAPISFESLIGLTKK